MLPESRGWLHLFPPVEGWKACTLPSAPNISCVQMNATLRLRSSPRAHALPARCVRDILRTDRRGKKAPMWAPISCGKTAPHHMVHFSRMTASTVCSSSTQGKTTAESEKKQKPPEYKGDHGGFLCMRLQVCCFNLNFSFMVSLQSICFFGFELNRDGGSLHTHSPPTVM